MKRIYLFTILIIITKIASLKAQQTISLDDIKDGMEGVGYTVVNGTNIQEFRVKVVSRLRKSWNGSDAILIRLSGLNLEHSGTVSGMSGSPIYFDGKLAGALAFGWQYSKDPLAGVTPIENMYKLYDDTNNVPYGVFEKNSLATPLMFSGYNSLSISEYKNDYEKLGFYPMQGAGTVQNESVSTNFYFGDSVAIVLVDGDLSVAGIGTISHVDDKKFLMFGHSMFSKGFFKAPVSKAYIHSVIPSSSLSFKMGSAFSNYLGYTVYDGAFGVSGVYGDIPDDLMIPIKLNIEDRQSLKKTVNFRVINDRAYFGNLLSQTLLNAISQSAGDGEEGIFSISYKIYTDYYSEPYSIDERVVNYKSLDSYRSLISSVLAPINFFAFNSFKEVKIKYVEITVKREGFDYILLNDVSVVENKIKAGDTIHLRVGMQEYGKDKRYITLPIKLPSNLATGNYHIFAGSENNYAAAEQIVSPAKYKIRSLEDVMTYYNKSYSDKKLKVWLYSSDRGVAVGSDVYPSLPPSYYGVLANTKTTDKGPVVKAIDNEYELLAPIIGMLNISIQVQGKE